MGLLDDYDMDQRGQTQEESYAAGRKEIAEKGMFLEPSVSSMIRGMMPHSQVLLLLDELVATANSRFGSTWMEDTL